MAKHNPSPEIPIIHNPNGPHGFFGVVSSGDMTGLVPAMPKTIAEAENYASLTDDPPLPERRFKGKEQ